MNHLQTVRSLDEDMAAIGLDRVDPHIAGIASLDEDDQAANKPKGGDDVADPAFEYPAEVQEAAMEIFEAARPQINESLIDYDEAEFNYDFLNSIAALIEAEVESGADLDDAKATVAEAVASTYNGLTLVEDEDLDEDEDEDLDEARARAKMKAGPRGKKIQGVGRNVRVGAGGRQVKKRTADDVKKSRIGALKRIGAKLTMKRKKGKIYRKSGKGKLNLRKAAVKRKAFNASVAEELRGLLAESAVENTTETLTGIRAELAEAFDRVGLVGLMLAEFFCEWGDDDDQGIESVLEDLAEASEADLTAVATLSEDEFNLEASMAKLQKYTKVVGRALDQYHEYALVDGEGNLIEMDDDDDDDDDDDGDDEGNE